MNLRLCYIPHIFAPGDTPDDFRRRLRHREAEDDYFAVITVANHITSELFLKSLDAWGFNRGLLYKSKEASSYRYPTLPPRLTLRVYSFKGL